MPLYTVQHSVALTPAQEDAIAQVITTAHSQRFGTPELFVNVSFQDISTNAEYTGGKRVHPNRIVATIRPDAPGAGRSDEAIEALLQEVRKGWDMHVGTKGEKALGAIFAETSLQVVIEKGVLIPKAGFDFEWIRENMASFKERAAKGDTEFGDLVKELEARSK